MVNFITRLTQGEKNVLQYCTQAKRQMLSAAGRRAAGLLWCDGLGHLRAAGRSPATVPGLSMKMRDGAVSVSPKSLALHGTPAAELLGHLRAVVLGHWSISVPALGCNAFQPVGLPAQQQRVRFHVPQPILLNKGGAKPILTFSCG